MMLPDSTGIDLESTLDGGQAFQWYGDPDSGYRGVIGSSVYLVRKAAGGVEAEVVAGAHPGDLAAVASDYVGTGSRFPGFQQRYVSDEVIGPILTRWGGLRVLRQDPWECLVAFIMSANNNVLRIKQNFASLAALGERIGPGAHDFRFPSPEAICETGEERLRGLGLGFRAAYVIDAAHRVADGRLQIFNLRQVSYLEARDALTSVHGIGEKIADCVMAFSLDKGEAFPVDRWVKRALIEHYEMPDVKNNSDAARWARQRFQADAAYVNQYLFHGQRMAAREQPGDVR